MLFRPELTRQWDLIPLSALDTQVHVIGAGAVGSALVIALAKMGFVPSVWDDDLVTTENRSCQWYGPGDVGRPKVVALRESVLRLAGVEVRTIDRRFDEADEPLPGIVVAAVDSMSARRTIWNAHKDRAFATRLFIDPRMGAETALIYAMKPCLGRDIAAYEKSLYSDNEAVAEPCTAKATMYTAMMLAGFVAKIVRDAAVGDRPYPRTAQWTIKDDAFTAWRTNGSVQVD